ncbi:MAG: hypothetical protein JNK85_12360 [Verrucomicrobiales bacterium]|nr:hypothetical protein [Verrucomicrobiales bacterium]
MLRIFLILSLAVALAGVAFSFVLKDKVHTLSEERTRFRDERDNAVNEATQAKAAEKKAKDAEKVAKDELDGTKQELTAATTQLNETQGKLAKTASELEETKVTRDVAQRELARWKALNISPDQIASLQTEAQKLQGQRDAYAEEKKVMGREIARLTDELSVYKGTSTEVLMPDVRGKVTSVDGKFQFVMLDIGTDNGIKQNGKMIITRGDNLVAKVQIVRVDSRSAIANLLPEWAKGEVQAGDLVMTSYEALAK